MYGVEKRMSYGETSKKPSMDRQREPGSLSAVSSPSPALERHYSVAEVAALWSLSSDAVPTYSVVKRAFSQLVRPVREEAFLSNSANSTIGSRASSL